MSEQSPRIPTSKGQKPSLDDWELVSDPFELPKVYRHKSVFIEMTADGGGIHLFVVEQKGTRPVILKNDNKITSAELTVLISGNPHTLGVANLIPKKNKEGFLNLGAEATRALVTENCLSSLEMITPDLRELPYRLKYVNGKFYRDDGTFREPRFENLPPDIRGTLDAKSVNALQQAIALSAYFNR